MTSTTSALPHWDMTVVYPGLESPEFERGFQAAVGSIDGLAELFERYRVGRREPAPLDDETVRAVEEVIGRYNAVLDETRTLGAYINSFVATNSRDNLAQAKLSEFQRQTVRLSQLGTRFTAWIGSLDLEGLIERSQVARDHAFTLRQAKRRAEHLMSPPEEDLAAELNLSGGTAWGKLHNNLTSQLQVRAELKGEARELPMSIVGNPAY